MPHELAVYKRNLARRPAQQAKLLPLVARRVLQVTQLTAQLRTRYDELQKGWEGSLARRELGLHPFTLCPCLGLLLFHLHLHRRELLLHLLLVRLEL